MDIDTDVEISSKQLETCICYAEERLLLQTYIWGVISFTSKFKLQIQKNLSQQLGREDEQRKKRTHNKAQICTLEAKAAKGTKKEQAES